MRNLNIKKKENRNKLNQKAERLEEIEKENEKRRDAIMKKIENMDIKREEYEKMRHEQILQKKKLREQQQNGVQNMQQVLMNNMPNPPANIQKSINSFGGEEIAHNVEV